MGTYRDDLEAAQARAEALDREVAELREKNAELEKRAQQSERATRKPKKQHLYEPAPPVDDKPPWPWWRKLGLVGFIVCMVTCAIAITQTSEDVVSPWDHVMWSNALLAGFFGWLALGAPAEA